MDAEAVQPIRRGWLSRLLPFRNPALAYSLTAVAIVLLVVAAIALIRTSRFRPQPGGRVLAIELTSGLDRGDGQIKTFSVAPVDTVELDLRIEAADDYQQYRAVLQTADGAEQFETDKIPGRASSGGPIAVLTVPAGVLVPGNYYVKLSGLNKQRQYENIGRYSFRVTSR
jgi:hypothetical protein